MKKIQLLQVSVLLLQVCKVSAIWEQFYELEKAKASTTTNGKNCIIIVRQSDNTDFLRSDDMMTLGVSIITYSSRPLLRGDHGVILQHPLC